MTDCQHCGAEAGYHCGQCMHAYYCNKACQEADWHTEHSAVCMPAHELRGLALGARLTAHKAREILHDKSVHGHPLTEKQRRFFGWVSSGRKHRRH